MRFKKIVGIAILVAAFYSCEKNVTVVVPEANEEIVVEGKIETGEVPMVVLSRTLPFFGEINTSSIILNTVTGATVIVNDGTISDTLAQLSPQLGVYIGSAIHGTPGKTYSLKVLVEGKTIQAVTYMPQPTKLDSLWWKVDGNRDSLGFAWGHLSDPDTIGNCYQWYAQRINHYTYGPDAGKIKDSTFIAAPGSAIEDKFFNGKSFDISVARGKFSFSNKEDDTNNENLFFKRGDTIVVKYCSISRPTFEFWRTEETQVQNNGNPFGSPAPITSNIVGGLGIWGAYSTVFDTIIAH